MQYRTDKSGIVHATIGRAGFKWDALRTNLAALVEALVKAKPASSKVFTCARSISPAPWALAFASISCCRSPSEVLIFDGQRLLEGALPVSFGLMQHAASDCQRPQAPKGLIRITSMHPAQMVHLNAVVSVLTHWHGIVETTPEIRSLSWGKACLTHLLNNNRR